DLAGRADLVVGAGTVLSAAQAAQALAAGARFIVAPNLSLEVARVALDAGVMYCPGAYTTHEILAARAAGAHVIKVYPVGVAGAGRNRGVLDLPHRVPGGGRREPARPRPGPPSAHVARRVGARATGHPHISGLPDLRTMDDPHRHEGALHARPELSSRRGPAPVGERHLIVRVHRLLVPVPHAGRHGGSDVPSVLRQE